MRALAWTLALAVVATGSVSGCKSHDDKACAHLMELAEAAGRQNAITMAQCQSELDEMKAECANPDEVLDCFIELDSLEQLGTCHQVCRGSGSEGAGE
jgi:hypothetical protein